MRINKYIASCGVCSRRKAEEYILSNKIRINDKVVDDLSANVSDEDKVYFDGKLLMLEEKKVYIMLNKPKGYITTSKEQFSRKSVLDLIEEKYRVFPVGRLDMDTEGLLLLTNDGELTNKIIHPTNKIEKTYIVKTKSEITDEKINKLELGVDIGDYLTKPAKVTKISNDTFQIVISEGKNRQIRKMCDAVEISIIRLKRIKIGNLNINDLKIGKYRYLDENDIKNIFV